MNQGKKINQLLIVRHYKSPKVTGKTDITRGIPKEEKIKANQDGKKQDTIINLVNDVGGTSKGEISCRYTFPKLGEPILYLEDETIKLENALSNLPFYDMKMHEEAKKSAMIVYE